MPAHNCVFPAEYVEMVFAHTLGAVATLVGAGRDRVAMWRRYLELLSSSVERLSDLAPLPGVVDLVDFSLFSLHYLHT